MLSLLVEETNRYYQQYLEVLDDGPSPLPDVTESEMFLFLAIIIQMGHNVRDGLADYWLTIEQFLTPFYGTTMKRDRFFHIIRFLHFSNNDTDNDKNDPNHDRLWKLKNVPVSTRTHSTLYSIFMDSCTFQTMIVQLTQRSKL
jgi:hypothetical protein